MAEKKVTKKTTTKAKKTTTKAKKTTTTRRSKVSRSNRLTIFEK